MKRLYYKFVNSFFSKSFLIFVIIGIINTLIHLGVYNLILFPSKDTMLANTFAFVTASTFSYFANVEYTYKNQTQGKTMFYSVIVFIAKLLLSNLLTYWFENLLLKFNIYHFIYLIPIPVTIIIIPLQFIAFNVIFKGSDIEKEKVVRKNKIWIQIVLSIFSFGIYYLYWASKIQDEILNIHDEKLTFQNKWSTHSGAKIALLIMMTFGFYGIYWNYKVSKIKKYNYKRNTILSFMFLQIASIALIQNNLNKEKEKRI